MWRCVVISAVIVWASWGCTPQLVQAIQANNPSRVEAMLEKEEVNVDALYRGYTPLMLAAQLQQVDIIHVLIKGGASVIERDQRGQSVLHYAACGASLSVEGLESLLAAGARSVINVQSEDTGDTPLHCAARQGDPAILALLLEAGADRALRNANQQTPFDAGITAGHTQAAERVITQEGRLLRCPRPIAVLPRKGKAVKARCEALQRELVQSLKLTSSFCQPLYRCVHDRFSLEGCTTSSTSTESLSDNMACARACPRGLDDVYCRSWCQERLWRPLQSDFEACARLMTEQ